MSRADPSVATTVSGPGSVIVTASVSSDVSPLVKMQNMSMTDSAVRMAGGKGSHPLVPLSGLAGVLFWGSRGFHFGGRVSIKLLASFIRSDGCSQPVGCMVVQTLHLQYQDS